MTVDPVLAVLGAVVLIGLAIVAITEVRYQQRQDAAQRRAASYDGSFPPSHPNCRCVLVPMWEPDTPVGHGKKWRAYARREGANGVKYRYTNNLYTTRRAADMGGKRLAARLNRGEPA